MPHTNGVRELPLNQLGTPVLTSPSAFLWWQARQQWGMLTIGILCGITTFLADAVLPYVVGRALDGGLSNGVDRDLLGWAAIMALAAVVLVTFGLIGHRIEIQNWLRASFSISELISNKITSTGDAVSEELPTGEVVASVATDAQRLGEVYAGSARFVGSVVAYVAVAIVMLNMSVSLGLVIAIGLPIVAVILAFMVKPLQSRQREQREQQGHLTTLGADTVSGLRILRGIGGESVFAGRYRAQSQKVREAGVRVAHTQSYLDALQVFLPGLLIALILWLGARQAVAGQISTGELVTFYGYAAFLTWPLQNVAESLQFLTRGLVAARKIIRVLQVQPAAGAEPGTAPMPDDDAPLTDTTSGVTLAAGRIVALVSEDPDESARIATRMGRFDDDVEAPTPVLLGDTPLRDIDLQDIRKKIVVAQASSELFSGGLREGLDARGGASDEQLLEALHIADAQDVLDSTPDGLNGTLAEKGRALSGGQRQRVALARALLTDVNRLILIEPTSAVDAHTEARIAQRLTGARRGRATLIVTASPLVLDHVDDVLVLRDGHVITSGTHRELLARSDDGAQHYRDIVGRELAMTDDSDSAHEFSDGAHR